MPLETLLSKAVYTVLIAMAPVVELRGAIPYGLAQGLPLEVVFPLAFLGNMLPVPLLILFTRRIFALLRKIPPLGRTIDRLEQKAHVKGRLVNRYKTMGLYVLVAIPLPGTGAWTGALVAAYLDIRLRHAIPAIAGGVLTAGVLVTVLSYSAFFAFTSAA